MKRVLLLLSVLFFLSDGMSQTYIGRQLVDQYPITSWGTKTYGLTWLPADYNTTTDNYPLIIFLHAGGEVGDGIQGLNNLLNAGIPKEIAAGWDPQAVNPADGKNYKFIVVSPQAPTSSGWSYTYTHVVNILPDILSRYRVDPKRIYITGISAGGAGTWSCVTNDGNFTQKIAAIIPVSAAGVNNPNTEASNIKYISGKYGVSVWALCGTRDALYNTNVSYVNTINTASPAPAVPAKFTGMTGLDHVPAVWDTAYKPTWRNNALNLSFYEWMLQYQRNVTSPPENKPPVANAGPDKNIKLPTNSVTLTGSGTDADGTISSYLWTKISGPSQFTIVSPSAAQTVINNLAAGSYQFQLKVTDNKYTYRTDTVTVSVTSLVNQIPVANAGKDQTITLPLNTVTLTGTGIDSDGVIASYLWTKVSGPTQFNIVSPTTAQTVVNNLVQGTYQFELKVTDNQGATKTDTVVIIVLHAPNKIPVANAGSDQTIILPADNVQLSGIASDTDGTIVSYEWIKTSGPEQFTIVSPSQSETVVNNLTEGVYEFAFKATDNDGASKEDTLKITVQAPPPNKIPVANAGSDQTIILPADNVQLSGIASDTDGTIVSYEWIKTSGPEQFTIVSPSQPQTVVNNLTEGVYEFAFKATDNDGASKEDTLKITVQAPPPNKIPVAHAGNDTVIYQPANSVALIGSGSDTDGVITSYQWNKLSGPDEFSIASQSDAQTTISDLTAGVYELELTVTDDDNAIAKDTVVITVMPPNQPPVVNAGLDQTIGLPVDSINVSGNASDVDGTITSYKWTKVDGPDQYLIVSSTQKQTAIINLVTGIYQFELSATDNAGATASDTVLITVLPPPNKIPVANAGHDTAIYQPANSVTLIGSGSDTDGVITSYQWNKLSGPDEFLIASQSDAQTTISDLTVGVYELELTVTDNDSAAAKDTVVITVMPPNQPPVVNAGSDQSIILPVNSATLSGNAADADGTVISYNWSKISGPAQYVIVSSTLAQTVINNLVAGVYQFELKATDNLDAATTDTVTVTVFPVPNKPPVANAGNDQTINLPNNSATLSGSGSDADGTIVSYLWSKVGGPDQYSITNSSQPQTPVNNLVAGIYLFELKVTDDSSASKTDTVAITVLSIPNQPPVANAGNDQTITFPTNNVTLAGNGTDADGTVTSFVWTKVSGPSQFNISNSNIKNPVVSNLLAGTYIFRLTVTDNNNASSTDDVNIIVNPMLAGYKTIPALIQAETYNAMNGVKTENTGDAGGGLDVGWIDNGDYMDYNVYVDSTGTYTVNFRVATANTNAKFQLRKSDGTVLTTVNIPNTASYQGWITLSTAIQLTAGYQTLRVVSTATLVWNFNWLEFVRGTSTGTPIPAKVEAENYAAMQGIQMEPTADAGGGLDVGWIDNGDWLDYNVNAAYAGLYTVNLRVATPNTGGKLQIKKSDGTVLSTVTIPKTNGWETWSTVNTSITLPAGQQTLRFASTTSNGFNFNWIQFVQPNGLIAQAGNNNQQAVEANSLAGKQSSILIAPNPVSNKFVLQIKCANTGTATIQVFNMQGELKEEFKTIKHSKNAQAVSLPAAGLAPGMYTILVKIGKWNESKIVMKL